MWNLEPQIKDVPRPAEPAKMGKNWVLREKFRTNSGELRIARGGFGAEACRAPGCSPPATLIFLSLSFTFSLPSPPFLKPFLLHCLPAPSISSLSLSLRSLHRELTDSSTVYGRNAN